MPLFPNPLPLLFGTTPSTPTTIPLSPRFSPVPLLCAVSLTSRIAITPPCAALALPQRACLSLRLLPLALSASPSHLAALLRDAINGIMEEKESETGEGGGHDAGTDDNRNAEGCTREAAEKLLLSPSEEGEKAEKERVGGMMDGRQQEGQQRGAQGGQQGGQQKRGLFHSMGRAIGWVQQLFEDEEEDKASSSAAMAATGHSALSVRVAAAAAAGGGLESDEIWEWATGYESGVHFDVAATDWSVAALVEGAKLSLMSSVGGGMDGSGGSMDAQRNGTRQPRCQAWTWASPACQPKLECRLGAMLVEAEGWGRAVQAASVKVGAMAVAVAVAVPGSSASCASLGANAHVPYGCLDSAAVLPASLRPLLRLHTWQEAGEAGAAAAAAAGGRGEGAVGSYGSLQAPLLHSLAPLGAVLPAHPAAVAREISVRVQAGWEGEGQQGVAGIMEEGRQAAEPLGLTADVSLSLHVVLVIVSYWPGMCRTVLGWWQDVQICVGAAIFLSNF
ncbi:unnamed protein product [Closterium sp. Yama58-4]|nr:unnamed protein product [Closterium sp. Yama58-4]